MKKSLAIILVMLLTMAISVCGFAEGVEKPGAESTQAFSTRTNYHGF